MSTKDMIRAAEHLEADAKKLREAADIIEHSVRFEPSAQNGTRAEQLASFIESRGGQATRTEIISESGIPAGTIASLLGSKKKFTKDARDFWHVKPKHQEVPAAHAESVAKQA